MVDSSNLVPLGKGLFGRPARLVVAAWALTVKSGVFSQHDAVKASGLPQSNVREELERLVAMKMLGDVPKGEGPGRRYYARLEHPAWKVIAAAVEAADEIARMEHAAQSPGRARNRSA